jgi:hypothetical protein
LNAFIELIWLDKPRVRNQVYLGDLRKSLVIQALDPGEVSREPSSSHCGLGWEPLDGARNDTEF